MTLRCTHKCDFVPWSAQQINGGVMMEVVLVCLSLPWSGAPSVLVVQ